MEWDKNGHSCHIAMFYITFSAFLTDTNSSSSIKENTAAVVSILASEFFAAPVWFNIRAISHFVTLFYYQGNKALHPIAFNEMAFLAQVRAHTHTHTEKKEAEMRAGFLSSFQLIPWKHQKEVLLLSVPAWTILTCSDSLLFFLIIFPEKNRECISPGNANTAKFPVTDF